MQEQISGREQQMLESVAIESSNTNHGEGDIFSVGQLFEGKSIFITGASGFIGRVLLEKLLRTYQTINTIYILMRPKRGVSPVERLHKQLLGAPIFDKLKLEPNGLQLLAKIRVISGDLSAERDFGISPSDMETLLTDKTLAFVFNVAAQVKFNEPLKVAIQHNLASAKTIIDLCKQLYARGHLRALCHVSTAFVNSYVAGGNAEAKSTTALTAAAKTGASREEHRKPIEERLYSVSQNPLDLCEMARLMDQDTMEQLYPKLIGNFPNTYTYTKALAEHLIAMEANELPVAIVRPSIVVGAWREPLEGWVDNLNGPSGVILAIGKGLLRSIHMPGPVISDWIPVDVVVNTMIAASFKVARNQQQQQQQQQKEQRQVTRQQTTTTTTKTISDNRIDWPQIFHCSTGDSNPLHNGQMIKFIVSRSRKFPSEHLVRYPSVTTTNHHLFNLLGDFFLNYLPAFLLDLLLFITGKKTRIMKIYERIDKSMKPLGHFITTNYLFKTTNLSQLRDCLTNSKDKSDLYMDIERLNWRNFHDLYVLGCRRYLLKEDDGTLEKSRKLLVRAYYVDLGVRILLLALAAAACCSIFLTAPLNTASWLAPFGGHQQQHLVSTLQNLTFARV